MAGNPNQNRTRILISDDRSTVPGSAKNGIRKDLTDSRKGRYWGCRDGPCHPNYAEPRVRPADLRVKTPAPSFCGVFWEVVSRPIPQRRITRVSISVVFSPHGLARVVAARRCNERAASPPLDGPRALVSGLPASGFGRAPVTSRAAPNKPNHHGGLPDPCRVSSPTSTFFLGSYCPAPSASPANALTPLSD